MTPDHALGEFDLSPKTERQLRVAPLWSWPLVLAALFFLGYFWVIYSGEHSSTALWWPASGVAVWFVLVNPPWRRHWVVFAVVVVTAFSNYVAGRPPEIALIFGVANGAETALVAWILGWSSPRCVLRSLRDSVRFTIAVLLGAWTAGLVAGVAIVQLGTDEILLTMLNVAASHAAAIFIIVPLVLLPPTLHLRVKISEVIIHAILISVVTIIVFFPGSHLPITFLLFPIVAWAAFRFPIRLVFIETSLTALLILGLTFFGGGPFRGAQFSEVLRIGLVELVIVTICVFSLILSATQYELAAVTKRARNVANLLNSGFITSRVGLLVAALENDGGTTVVWRNKAAATFLADNFSIHGQWTGALEKAAREALDSHTEISVDLPGPEPRTVSVVANPVTINSYDDARTPRMAVQMLDVTTSVQAQRIQLNAARAESAALLARIDLERQRDDFVATTSHELRTPITSIVGYTELLLDSEDLPDVERSWVQIIGRNASRLSDLVEDLLTLGKAVRGVATNRQAQTLNAKELVHDTCASQQIVAENKGVELTCDMGDEKLHAVRADVTRIITNLVANAIKFTPPGGTVTISAISDGKTTTLTVKDTGPGMTRDALEHAFERFYRAPQAEADNIPGTGLGLSIVAELVHRNRGKVVLESPPGKGIVAIVSLPAVPPRGSTRG